FHFGYRNNLLIGIALVIIALILLPFFQIMSIWFVLRIVIGIGVMLLQISGQSWMSEITQKKNRGFILSSFGACFGAGFALGPLMINVLSYSVYLPFLLSAALYSLAFFGISRFVNKYPHQDATENLANTSSARFYKALKLGWIAFLCPLIFGLMEATLNGVFPAYGIQIGYSPKVISLLISSFALGSIIFQIPIGKMSDYIGRFKILSILVSLGALCFVGLIIFEVSLLAVFILLSLSGVFVGTLFSLGISFMADILPAYLLPAGSIICSIFYSAGSIGGPLVSGGIIDMNDQISIFYIFLFGLLILLFSLFIFKRT